MVNDYLVEKLASDIADATTYKLACLNPSFEKTAGALSAIKGALGEVDPKTLLGYGLGSAARGGLYGGALGSAIGGVKGAVKGYRGAQGSLKERLKAGLTEGARGGAKGGLIGAGTGAGLGAVGGLGNVGYTLNALKNRGLANDQAIQNLITNAGSLQHLGQEGLDALNALRDIGTRVDQSSNLIKNMGFLRALRGGTLNLPPVP